MFSRIKSIVRTINYVGDTGFPKLQNAVENFVTAFNEFSHGKKFDIFVCEQVPNNFRKRMVRRLEKLDEFPAPIENYKSGIVNSFEFYLEHWDESNYSALILGTFLLTPLNIGEFHLSGQNALWESDFLFRISNDDPPSKRELRNYFEENRDFSQLNLKKKLSKSELHFTRNLTENILPVWRSAPIYPNWCNLKNSSSIELPYML